MPVVSSPRVIIPNVLAGFLNNPVPVLNFDAVSPAKRPRKSFEFFQSINDNLLFYYYFINICIFYSQLLFLLIYATNDSFVNSVAIPLTSDDVAFNQLATVLSTTSILSPKQSSINEKRGRGRPRKIQSKIYFAYLL